MKFSFQNTTIIIIITETFEMDTPITHTVVSEFSVCDADAILNSLRHKLWIIRIGM